jgi:DNA repair exonuclease SbcCD ATPase subunit
MLDFIDLKVQNFLSYQSAYIPLDKQGVVLLTGRCVGDPSANSNGAGKSALLPEALLYALFGRTLRGLRGEDVVNDTAGKDCAVTLRLKNDAGTDVLIERVQKTGSDRRTRVQVAGDERFGADEITRVVEETLGLHFETFASTAIYGKGDTKFFTQITDEPRKKILDDLMSLHEVNQFHNTARNLLDSTNCDLTKLREEHIQLAGQVGAFETTLAQLKEHEAEFEKGKKAELRALAEQAKFLDEQTQALSRRKKKIGGNEAANLLTTALENDYKTLSDGIESMTAHTLELHRDEMKKLTLQHELESEQSAFADLTEDLAKTPDYPECPTCYQVVPEQHVQRIKGKQIEHLAEAVQHSSAATTKLTTAKTVLEKAKRQQNDLAAKLTQLRDEKARLQTERASCEREAALLTQKFQSLEQRVLEVQQRANTAGQSRETLEKQLANAQKEGVRISKEVASTTESLKYLEFWTEGFSNRGIKSMMLDQVVPFLNERARHHASLLTDGAIAVEFATQREMKSGERRDKFDVVVRHFRGGKSYRSCSDGQRRRADIVCTLALGDLSATRVSSPINLAIVDEIFDGLDATGIERALPLLMGLAQDRSSVFVISHSDAMANYFPKTWTVVYENGISHVEF